MKRKIALIIAVMTLLSCLSVMPASADSGGYTITNYDFSGVLHENNVVSVTETIDVNFNQSRHGIYRSFPLETYVGRNIDESLNDTLRYRYWVENISVEGWTYDIEEEDGVLDIKIGDANRYVSGDQQYVINYNFVMPDDRIDSTDFIFYSVLGSYWNTTIDKFSFNLRFEKEIPEDSAKNFAIYSGYYGGEENNLNIKFSANTKRIRGDAKDIRPNQAITLFTKLPNDYFKGARKTSGVPMLVCFGILGAVTLLTIVLALTTRRKEVIETVEFYPPDGVTPAEVGTIIDESADDIDLMALIPYWAQKGYLTIEEVGEKRKKHLVLHAVKSLPSTAPDYEKKLFYAFFGTSDTCDMKKDLKISFAEKFKAAKNSLKAVFTGDRKLSTGHFKAIVLVFLSSLTLFGVVGLSSEVYLTDYIVYGAVAAVPMLIFGVATSSGLRTNFKKAKGKISYGLLTLICFVVSIGVCLFFVRNPVMPVYVLFAAVALAAINGIAASRIIKDTDYRVENLGKLRGLKNFIETAELDRLKMLLEENPDYYYEVLPYAMVFNLVDKWAKQFKMLEVKQPSWYYGYDDMTMWEVMYLNRMLHTNVRQPISHINAQAAAQAAARAASSSSSGGFSGGGGGGGGGGSW